MSELTTSKSGLILFITIIWLSFFLLRFSGPHDLMDRDQERPISYIMDAVQNNNWICQRDYKNNITSKPPVYTWLAALTALPFERINRFAIYFPNALAVLLTAYIIWIVGSTLYDKKAGFLGAIVYILSISSYKQLCLARTDPLFTLFTALTALLTYRAWISGRGWTRVWTAAAITTLTKGPLGVLLAAGGLTAYFREKKNGRALPLRGNHLPGLFVFLLITLGWFLLAYRQCGQDLIDKMIFNELLGHSISTYKGKIPGAGFYKPVFYFITRFLPWSLFAAIGFWRIWKNPASDPGQRTAEHFIFCFFFTGLCLFSLAPHQRNDLIFPLLPAAAVLSGRELGRRVRSVDQRTLFRSIAGITAVILLLFGAYDRIIRTKKEKVRDTEILRQFAHKIEAAAGNDFPFTYISSDYSFQFYLNTLNRFVSNTEAMKRIEGNKPVFIVGHPSKISTQYLARKSFYELARCPDSGPPLLVIVSNTPRLERSTEPLPPGPSDLTNHSNKN